MANLEMFRRDTDTVTLQPGEVLFHLGDEANEAYVVTEGNVDVVVNGRVIDVVGEGGIIGELALIDVKKRSATVRANTQATLARINSVKFMHLIQQTPFFAITVMQTMSERMRKMHDLITSDSNTNI